MNYIENVDTIQESSGKEKRKKIVAGKKTRSAVLVPAVLARILKR